MLKFLVDENLDRKIVRGLLRRNPTLDIVCVPDVGLTGCDDPTVLEWAAQENRALLTYDVNTIPRFAYERIQAELPMPGVVEIDDSAPIGKIIEDILLLAECSFEGELEGQVAYLPLK